MLQVPEAGPLGALPFQYRRVLAWALIAQNRARIKTIKSPRKKAKWVRREVLGFMLLMLYKMPQKSIFKCACVSNPMAHSGSNVRSLQWISAGPRVSGWGAAGGFFIPAN